MQISENVFRAYDIRGIWPEEVSTDLFYALGRGYAAVVRPNEPVAVGYDVRVHSKELAEALIEGLIDSGVDVVNVGMGTTDMIYFATGFYNLGGGIQSTASHNPAEWHGAKVMREGVKPLTLTSGLEKIRDLIKSDSLPSVSERKGRVEKRDILPDYIKFLSKFIDRNRAKPAKIVYNANFGYQGKVFEKLVLDLKLPIEIVALNGQPDGTFPKGRPDPLIPENRAEFLELVKSTDADLGVAWDADADRCFFAARGGSFVHPVYSNAVLIKDVLKKHPGAKIIYNTPYKFVAQEAIRENGGTPLMEKVGHGYIKDRMRKEGAAFACEHSAHTFYKEFWNADCGLLPLLQMLSILWESGSKLSDLVKPWQERVFISDEINSQVSDVERVLKRLEERYRDANLSKFDGLIFEYPDWRGNVRPSSNEPRLRLNIEARSKKLMEEKRDEVLKIIRGG